jgi:PAS domain S-box-containing protein
MSWAVWNSMVDPTPLELRHLARIVDSSEDAIISRDLHSMVRSWNRAAEELFGYTSDEAVGQPIHLIVPADRQNEEDDLLARVRAGEEISHFETIRRRKDGSLIPISLSLSAVRDDSGQVVGATTIARDIGPRKQAESAIRRLAAVVEWSDDAIITKNLDSTITSWNRAAERMFGYTAAEAIGRSIRILIPEDLQSEEDMVLSRIRANQNVDHFETRRIRKDGSEVIISLTVSPILDDSGRVVGASKIARDITEQSRLRALAREQALITERLGEVGAAIAASLDTTTIMQRVIDLATSLTGAETGAFHYDVDDPESAETHTLSACSGAADAFSRPVFRPDEMRDSTVVRLDDLTPGPAQAAATVGLPAGRPVRSYLAISFRAASGNIVGQLCFGHSEAGMFTKEHERLLQGVATWATLALENARLYVVARNADRLKDEFLAVLSHELRTPLNAILGYARLLKGGILDGEKAHRALETLERNATSLTQIVEDVLDISRIVTGKIRLDVQMVELPLIIHNAVATVRPTADAKGVELQTVIDPRVGAVSGDPGRLQQVLWNLLSNAVKFTRRGGRVQVRLERVNSHVEIAVSDTGAGIRPDFLPHVFERFRQGDAGIARQPGGLGLGLSIVRHIVEMHGGWVEALSEGEGHGSTFRVRLPLMIVQPERASEPREHPRTERFRPLTELIDLHGVRVLAIDDEQDALTLLRAVLEAAGAVVITLSSAAVALDQIASIGPHAIVVDLGMAGMDGFEFIARLRSSADARIRDIPAAALTAFARSEDRTKALRSGFEMHLAKPIDPGELVASVATLVKRSRRETHA